MFASSCFFQHLLTKLSAQPDGTVDYESFIESFQRTDAEASKTWLENVLKDDIKSLSPRSTAQNSPPSYEILEEQVGDMIQAKYRKISKVCWSSRLVIEFVKITYLFFS